MGSSTHAAHTELRKATKSDIAAKFMANLRARGEVDVFQSGLAESILRHFQLLPTRYALDVNIEGIDVLNHAKLLLAARTDPSAVFFHVRPVEVFVNSASEAPGGEAGGVANRTGQSPGKLPRPAFGSWPNLQSTPLAQALRRQDAGGPNEADAVSLDSDAGSWHQVVFYEITVASSDQPKLLSRLSEGLNDVGLNIREAHAFNTTDKFSLDVFIVDGWNREDKDTLEQVLSQRFSQLPPPPAFNRGLPKIDEVQTNAPEAPAQEAVAPSSSLPDDWEVNISQLEIESKIASGSFGTLYKGKYCGQDVAVKILKDVQSDGQQFQEFLQEVSIMRKVRHKNVVQFIGACTHKPNLCIVFEYMAGGSLYEHIRRSGPLPIPALLKVALEVSKGMDYLHQRVIVHRDLKAANLLLDENGTVKIADFGVARFLSAAGVMTAETGTYRWMAPEVVEHRPYNEKADVFSFAIVLWELLTGQVPYAEMTPLQAAVGVVLKALRPQIPPNCPAPLSHILKACWQQDAAVRPSFKELTPQLEYLLTAAREEAAAESSAGASSDADAAQRKTGGGFFSKLRRA